MLLGHPAVAQVAVVPRPDAVMGELGVAVVVPADPSSPAGPRRPPGLRRRPPGRLQAPEALVLRDELPLTAMDKLDRRRLTAEVSTSNWQRSRNWQLRRVISARAASCAQLPVQRQPSPRCSSRPGAGGGGVVRAPGSAAAGRTTGRATTVPCQQVGPTPPSRRGCAPGRRARRAASSCGDQVVPRRRGQRRGDRAAAARRPAPCARRSAMPTRSASPTCGTGESQNVVLGGDADGHRSRRPPAKMP